MMINDARIHAIIIIIIFESNLDLIHVAVSQAAGLHCQFASVPSSTVRSDEATLSRVKPLTNCTLPPIRRALFKPWNRQQNDDILVRLWDLQMQLFSALIINANDYL